MTWYCWWQTHRGNPLLSSCTGPSWHCTPPDLQCPECPTDKSLHRSPPVFCTSPVTQHDHASQCQDVSVDLTVWQWLVCCQTWLKPWYLIILNYTGLWLFKLKQQSYKCSFLPAKEIMSLMGNFYRIFALCLTRCITLSFWIEIMIHLYKCIVHISI